jgi:hypothetical protein
LALARFARKVNQRWREMADVDIDTLQQPGISEAEIVEVADVVELFYGFSHFARTMQVEVDV